MRLTDSGARGSFRLLVAAAAVCLAFSETVQVNFGYFQEAAAHLWTYGVDSHSWTDPVSGDEFVFTFWPQTSGGRVFEKVSVGDLDFAVLGSAPWGISSTRSLPAKLVYNIKSVDQGEVFACRSDIVEPRDLRGKRVAYVPGSTVHYMMDALLSFTALSWSDFEWVGGLNPGDQKAAWDAGEIDCGFVWMPVLAHIQTAPWCSSPDDSPSSAWRSKLGVASRPCAAGPKGVHGHSFFTGGMATMWGKGVWNGLVVSDAFAARYTRTVQRSLKVMSAMDSKFVEDRGFFTASETRLCMICTALGWPCDATHYDRVKNDVALDAVQTWAEQRSPAFLGEQAPGQCALEAIPPAAAAESTCTKLTASSSALSTYASAAFNFGLKNLPHLPTLKHYQDHVDSSYMELMGGTADAFPELDAEELAANYTAPLQGGVDGAAGFCQDVPQPIVLGTPGTFRDHDGGGFYKEGGSCTWHIDQAGPVLLSDVTVRTEANRDHLFVYAGLCTPSAGDCDTPATPLLAVFSGGKGRPASVAQRPPLLIPGGRVTVVFSTDGVVDRPLAAVVDEGISMTWSSVAAGSCPLPCQNGGRCEGGLCQCTGGWSGADCSHAACLGTVELPASSTPASIVHGPMPGTAHGSDCRWVLTAAGPDEVVVVEFVSLDVESYRDPVSFYSGDAVDAGQLLGSFGGYIPAALGYAVGQACPGASCPQTLTSSGSTMLVRWTSDFVQSGRGFELRYSSQPRDAVLCGRGATAGCSGHGRCTASGCECEEGAYGALCQYKQCVPGSVVTVASASGTFSNMAASELGYSPVRDCAWQLTPPATSQSGGNAIGAIAIFVTSFDLEADFRSSDRLLLGQDVEYTGSNPPCVEDAVCSFDADCLTGTCSAGGRCQCPPAAVVVGTATTVKFETDLNDFPSGALHRGFRLRYEAVYECPRNHTTGLCLGLDECATQRTIPGRVVCEHCPPGSVYKFIADIPTCEACARGFYHDAVSDTCVICPAGHFANETGSTACEPCMAGHQCSTGALQMDACLPGHFASDAGADECSPCVSGSFAEHVASTSCMTCGAGKASAASWTTIAEVQTAHGSEFSKIMGAVNRSACGCDEGLRLDFGGECISCEEGLVCKLNSVEVEPGFVGARDGDGSLSIFSCRRDIYRCPGGEPMTCAAGRTGVACSECQAGLTPTSNPPGTCIDCQGADLLPFIAVAVAMLVGLVAVYVALDRQTRAVQSHSLLICSFSLVQFATLMQQLSAVSTIPVTLPEPVKSFVNSARLFMFDIDILKLDCMATMRPLTRFTTRSVMVLVCVAIVFVIHAAFVALFRGRDYKARQYVLVCTVGTVFTVFLTQVLITLVGPFQCFEHPNGEWTALDYQGTLCWNSSEHTSMLVVAFVIAPFPLAYIAKCVHTILRFPRAVAVGDFDFVQRYQFLFARFKADCYYYSAVPLFGNLAIALATVIPNPSVQIVMLQVVLLTTLVLVFCFWPWRVTVSNVLDASLTCATLLAVGLCAFFTGLSTEELMGLTWLVGVILSAAAVAVPVCIGFGLCKILLRRSKPISFFICSHKEGSGVLAKLLKFALSGSDKVGRRVFLDSDDQASLDSIFNTVAHETQTLVVLASKGLLLAQRCVGEMTTARLKGVRVEFVQLPDFQEPDAPFVGNYDKLVNTECLTSNGIQLQMIQDTLTWVCGLPRLALPRVSGGGLRALVAAVAEGRERAPGTLELKGAAGLADGRCGSRGMVVDGGNAEAVATAVLLQKLLVEELAHDAQGVPVLMEADAEDSRGAFEDISCRLVLCTNGCLKQRGFLSLLLPGPEGLSLVPVVCEEAFRFPTEQSVEELRQDSDLALGCPDFLAQLVAELFAATRLTFTPATQPEKTFKVQALCVARYLRDDNAGVKALPLWTSPAGGDDKTELRKGTGHPTDDDLAVVCCTGKTVFVDI